MGWLILALYLAACVASYRSIMSCHKASFPNLWKEDLERYRFTILSRAFSLVWPISWPAFLLFCGWHGFKYK